MGRLREGDTIEYTNIANFATIYSVLWIAEDRGELGGRSLTEPCLGHAQVLQMNKVKLLSRPLDRGRQLKFPFIEKLERLDIQKADNRIQEITRLYLERFYVVKGETIEQKLARKLKGMNTEDILLLLKK